MPRRRALTEAQLEGLLALPTAEAEPGAALDPGRRRSRRVGRRRRDHNRLGFALQLCALRYPGRLLRPGELIPAAALRFVADQLGAEPEALAAYAARSRPATSSSMRCATHSASPTSRRAPA